MILKEKIKQDIPLNNKSYDKNKELIINFINKFNTYKDKIYEVYKDDFKYLPIE